MRKNLQALQKYVDLELEFLSLKSATETPRLTRGFIKIYWVKQLEYNANKKSMLDWIGEFFDANALFFGITPGGHVEFLRLKFIETQARRNK